MGNKGRICFKYNPCNDERKAKHLKNLSNLKAHAPQARLPQGARKPCMEILPECFTSSTITASQSTASLLQNPPSLSMKYAQWLQPTGSPADQVMECTQETTALGRPSLDLLLPEARGINQPFIELNYSDSRFPAFTASLCTTLRCRTFFQIISKNITVQNRHCSR